ncbi:MAG: hypothetical protein RMI90_11780 [Thermoguttaceae bacterium]|nr:hypothetical protein [Thermoguttaceae bacterium]
MPSGFLLQEPSRVGPIVPALCRQGPRSIGRFRCPGAGQADGPKEASPPKEAPAPLPASLPGQAGEFFACRPAHPK